MRNLLIAIAILVGTASSQTEQVGSALADQSGQVRGRALYSPSSQAESVSDEEFSLPVDDQLAATIDSMIAGLGSPEYKEREAATAALLETGPRAFAKLRTAYDQSDELEVRSRIETIVRTAYLNYHVYGRNGFLGISQRRVPRTREDDPRIPDGHFGIQVQNVIENTAAQSVGFAAGDVIIALNGEPLMTTTGTSATAAFGESIRLHGPGVGITLTVLRGPRQFDVEVILGDRPRRYYSGQGKVTQMLHQFRRQFEIWWVKHFRQPPMQQPGGDRP